MTKRIRVVVVDDSPFICELLTRYLQSSPDFEVVATALNGKRAVEKVKALRPDAVTLDLGMPEMDGLEALGHIMRDCPTPVVVISGVSGRAATRTLQALDLGAVDFVLKYTGTPISPVEMAKEIVAKVRVASTVRVIRLLDRQRPAAPLQSPRTGSQDTQPVTPAPAVRTNQVIVIGASTGGPVALQELLQALPREFAVPIVVVQHMPASFTGVLAKQLDRQCSLDVREAEDGDKLRPGLVLVAPGGYHLLLRSNRQVQLHSGPDVGGHCPSINVTMESAAYAFGWGVTGVILTGMGEDGANGLGAIRAKGGRTYAQDAESCVVNGMPQRAIEKGAVELVAPPAEIAQALRKQFATEKEEQHVHSFEVRQ